MITLKEYIVVNDPENKETMRIVREHSKVEK